MKKVFTLVVLALFGFFAVSCNEETGSDISSLKNSISTIEQQLGSINTSITALESLKSAVDATVSAFEEDNSSSKAEIASLKEQSEKLSKEVESLKTYVDELKGTKSWAEASFATLQQMEDLETSVAAIKASLPMDYAKISEAFSALETSLKSWVGEELLDYSTTAAMNARVAEAEQAAKDADDDLKEELAGEVKAVSDELATLNDEFNSKVKALINEAVAAGGVVNDEIAKQVKAAQDELNTKISALDTRVTSLESRIGIAEGKISVVEGKIPAINASIATLEIFRTYIDEKVDSLEAENSTDKAAIADLKSQSKQLGQEIEDLKKEFDNKVNKLIDAALEEGGSINDEIAAQVKTAVDSIEPKITTINGKLTDLESKVKALEDTFAEILGRIQSIVVVPTYTDGSVDIPGEVKFEIRPVEAAKALVAIEGVKDSIKFQAVSVATKGGGSNFNDFVVESVKMDDLGELVLVSVALPSYAGWPDTFKAGYLDFQARLKVEANSGSGNYVCKASEYFPVNPPIPVTAITLDKTEVTLHVEDTATLSVVSVEPENARDQTITWSSDNTAVATVDTNGVVTAIALGTAAIIATANDGSGVTASCAVTVAPVTPEYVDLGLSVKWATFNVGASSPAKYGNYYAWGETETKDTYSWATYKYAQGSMTKITKYCTQSSYGYNKVTDNKTTLEPEDDVAYVEWGSYWRMPTKAEQDELRNNCDWSWTTDYEGTGVAGFIVKSKTNDNSIFLPAAGYMLNSAIQEGGSSGSYWPSSLNKSYNIYPSLNFKDGTFNSTVYVRMQGHTVRAVYDDAVRVTGITLNKTAATISAGNTETLAANVAPADATNKNVTWSSDNTAVASVDANGVVTAVAAGTAIITATTVDGGLTATCTITVGHEYVDLGLSVKWATMNVGASSPEDYGNYYSWGETAPSNYNWDSYKWGVSYGSFALMTKYCTSSDYGKDGSTDNITTLEASDDAATANWGGTWRMPTKAEWAELKDSCSFTWTTEGGVNGFKVQSLVPGYTDNYIFLPAAGSRYDYTSSFGNGSFCYYWSSTLHSDCPWNACLLSGYIDGSNAKISSGDTMYRYYGLCVRPVTK